MASSFLHLASTPAVVAAQLRYHGHAAVPGDPPPVDQLGPDEREFIAARDSFYLATVTETGWPYVQHRGGPSGFLRVLDSNLLGFADVRGNRQLLSTGNLAANNRVALFLMDYPQRTRLKILGHARVSAAEEDPELARQLAVAGGGPVERLVRIEVVGYDWNCPKHITPRYTKADVEEVVGPLQRRIAELEEKLREQART